MKGCFIIYLTIYKVIVHDIEPSYGEAMNHLPSSSSKLSRIILLLVGHFVPMWSFIYHSNQNHVLNKMTFTDFK